MAKIKNIDGMTLEDIKVELARGAKFVAYQYCISIIFMTFKRNSDIYFIRDGESVLGQGIGFIAFSFLFGWWGFPWGPIYTIESLYTNFTGGKDVTKLVINNLNLKP